MVFREEEHPRDGDGKFTDKNGVRAAYNSRNDFAEQVKRVASVRAQSEEKPIPEKAARFNRLETKHHQRHAKEMGFKNTRDYARAAVEFFNSGRGSLYYSQERKRWYRYDEKTQEMAVSSDGIIHTFTKYPKRKFEKVKRQDKLDER